MGGERARGVRGWLLVYVFGSIPVLLFFSAGLSGWFLDYPIGLWLTLFVVLASPLLLIWSRSPEAPRWNIAALWIASILITVRIAYGVLFQRIQEGLPRLTGDELLEALPLLLGIVLFSLGWATAWTRYYRKLWIGRREAGGVSFHVNQNTPWLAGRGEGDTTHGEGTRTRALATT